MYILTKQYTNKISSTWNVHWQRGLVTSSHNLDSAIPLLHSHVKVIAAEKKSDNSAVK